MNFFSFFLSLSFVIVANANECEDQYYWEYYCDSTLNLTCLNDGICNSNHRCVCSPLTCGGNCGFKRKIASTYNEKYKGDFPGSQRYLGFDDRAKYIKTSEKYLAILFLASTTILCLCVLGYTLYKNLMNEEKEHMDERLKRISEKEAIKKHRGNTFDIFFISICLAPLFSIFSFASIVISGIYYSGSRSLYKEMEQLLNEGMIVDANGCCLYYDQ